MKKLLFIFLFILGAVYLQAQSISHIETTKSWYYIYDQNGKKIKTISTSQGELKGYSSTFYIIKQGSGFYITYDVNGKRLHTFGANAVGEIVGAAGDTFTGYFLASILSGKGVKIALKRAATAASVAISRRGASLSIPYACELQMSEENCLLYLFRLKIQG